MFLSELLRANLPEAQVHHERAGWMDLGVNCPDASHLTRFNCIGNAPEIRSFWERKLSQDVLEREDIYAEATHLHAKAGLIENLDLVPDDVRVVIVAQKREPLKIVWSLHNRFDFANFGFTWLFALDPRYPNVIVNSKPMQKHGPAGYAIWYVVEMEARMAYYRMLLEDRPNVTFHQTSLEEIATQGGAKQLIEVISGDAPDEVNIPPPANQQKRWSFGEDAREKIAKLLQANKWDAEKLAGSYFDAGARLATPRRKPVNKVPGNPTRH